jgi:hypothetical protein
VGLDIPYDKTDQDLFHASTVVTVGNGNKALFGNPVGSLGEHLVTLHHLF